MDVVAIQQALALARRQLLPSAVASPLSVVVDRPSGVIEGLPLYAYGNSHLAQTGNAAAIYFDRIRRRIGGVWVNYGVGGFYAEDACTYAYGGYAGISQGVAYDASGYSLQKGSWQPQALPSGVVLLDNIGNSSGNDGNTVNGGTSAKARTSYVNATDAHIRLVRSMLRQRLDTISTTAGSDFISDPFIAPGDLGQPVTAATIPAGSYVGTVTSGAGYLLSSSPTSQVNVNATATASGIVAAVGASTTTGSWTAVPNYQAGSGNATRFTQAPGSTATYTLTLPVASAVSWVGLGVDEAASGYEGAPFSVTATPASGAPVVVSGTTRDQAKKSQKTGNTVCQMAVPLGVLPAGAWTIVVQHTGVAGSGATAQTLFDDCLLVESPTPPTVVGVKQRQLTTTGYSLGYPGTGASWVIDQAYNALMDTVAGRFPADTASGQPTVLTWDPNAHGWSPTSMIGSGDGFYVHSNDSGERCYADGLMAVLNTLTARAGLVRT